MSIHHCPACHATASTPFLDNEPQPLATLGWPKSDAAARAMPRLALDWVRCTLCGHVYNAVFDYRNVPYSEHPNLMFNRGSGWVKVIDELRGWLLDRVPQGSTSVEIGYGDGSFIAALAQSRPDMKLVGFDPDGSAHGMPANVTLHKALFAPETHFAQYKPALIYARHVLEHLEDPLAFLQAMGLAAIRAQVAPIAYFEVPCVDNSLARFRTADFFYEHVSQFSTDSFRRMLTLSGGEVVGIGRRYAGEVIWGLVQFGAQGSMRDYVRQADAFRFSAAHAKSVIGEQLDELLARGKKIAVWGGTGKSAGFMQRYGLDAARFPLVVDSDQAKVGTFVPGSGQQIQFRDVLKTAQVDVVIIPPQWRARDIHAEMQREGIAVATVLVEDEGRLVDLPALMAANVI